MVYGSIVCPANGTLLHQPDSMYHLGKRPGLLKKAGSLPPVSQRIGKRETPLRHGREALDTLHVLRYVKRSKHGL